MPTSSQLDHLDNVLSMQVKDKASALRLARSHNPRNKKTRLLIWAQKPIDYSKVDLHLPTKFFLS